MRLLFTTISLSKITFAALFLLLLSISPLHAISRPTRAEQEAQLKATTTRSVPVVEKPLHLSDFAGMKPTAALQDKLLHITGFIQNSPHDGEPATEATEVWIARTNTEIDFVFICHDRTPNLIRGHLARRENILKDDNVAVLLDPFQDHRTGVLFSTNPVGVQADAAWTEANGTDYTYDAVWNSEGRVTSDGWMALISIPFRSIRFHPNNSNWGIVLERNLPRNSEFDTWPRVAANISGVLTQEGTLSSITGVSGSHNIQINPYTLGQNEKTLETIDPVNPYFSSRAFEGTAGGEIKAILKDSIVVDATINPDFSDIESDQPQFTVNQRYPVFFPELRPFFLENAGYFSTPINLVYTRNIVNPEYGIRITGKIDKSNIGLFVIDDREPGFTVAPGDPLYKKRATIAVGRFSEDIGKGSSLGLMYTDYEFGQGFNRIGGADFTLRFNDHWNAQGQMVESATLGDIDSGTPIPYSAGPSTTLQVQRSGHAFNFQGNYNDVSTGYISDLGFQQSSNIRSAHEHTTYQWFPKKSKLIQSWGYETNVNIAFDHQGDRVYRYLTFDPFLLLARNTVIAPIGGQNSDTVGPSSYPTLTHYTNFTENFGGFVIRSAPSTMLNFNLVAIKSGNVNYNPPYIPNTDPPIFQNPFLMNQETVSLLFSFQPMRQLTSDNTYLLDRDHDVHGGDLVYEAQVFRTKINYQFTRALSARVIVEYDSTLANPSLTSLLRTKEVGTEALITWLPHPGTAIYVGYNNDIQNLDRSLCNRLPILNTCDPNNTTPPRSANYLNDGKQIFVKASYLFRF
jgi:hypothetical protein